MYDGCVKFIRLLLILKFYKLKVSNGWSDKSFTGLFSFLKDILLEDMCFLVEFMSYEVKCILFFMDMIYERIYVCFNDFILFRNEYVLLSVFFECNILRYKKEGINILIKILYIFNIIDI